MFFGLHSAGAFCNLIFPPPPSSILFKKSFWCFCVAAIVSVSVFFLGSFGDWMLVKCGRECLGLVSVIGMYFLCIDFLRNTICYKDGPACFSYSVQLSCSRAQKFAAILAYWVE